MKKKLIIFISTLVGIFILNLIIGVIIYNCIFGFRCESKTYLMPTIEEYPNIEAERHEFITLKNKKLVGYLYSNSVVEEKGVVVFAHGFGGGGQIGYLDIYNYLTSNGYYVFAYDATGNDESEGRGVNGFPQGIIDLEHAIKYTKTISEVGELPMMLMGFSWGAYSVSNVLNFYSDVEAVVALSGFNESTDMIEYHSFKYVWHVVTVTLPFAKLLEKIKFGKYAGTSAIDGFANTDAKIMIVHSEDDPTVPIKYGYDKYYEVYGNDERFIFKHYDDKDHSNIYKSREWIEYYDEFMDNVEEYEENNPKATNQMVIDYINQNLDREKLINRLDYELMDEIVDLFNSCL